MHGPAQFAAKWRNSDISIIRTTASNAQFCAAAVQSRTCLCWVKFGSPGAQLGSPLYPQEQTSPAGPVRSEKCQHRKSLATKRSAPRPCLRELAFESRSEQDAAGEFQTPGVINTILPILAMKYEQPSRRGTVIARPAQSISFSRDLSISRAVL